MIADRTDLIDPEYEVGVGTHYLYGELEHLMSVAREASPLVDCPSLPARAGEIFWSCCKVPNFDYLHTDDPRPLIRQVRTELGQAAMRRLE